MGNKIHAYFKHKAKKIGHFRKITMFSKKLNLVKPINYFKP